MGRSVKDLAEEVDNAKALLDMAEGRLAEQRGRVAAEEENVRLAQEDYDRAVEALVTEHPHLVGTTPRGPSARNSIIRERNQSRVKTDDDSLWETIEVDDENDPRYTAGVPLVSPDPSEPIGAIDFEERDGE